MSLVRVEERTRDLAPLVIERRRGFGAARTAIPVACVVWIAFLAVQIGVHPGSVSRVDLLRQLVRAAPVAPRIVPEGLQQGRLVVNLR